MPRAYYTVLRNWILTATAILKALLVIEVGTDKAGWTRRGRGRGAKNAIRGVQSCDRNFWCITSFRAK